jgi:hypothetical protein
LQAELHSIYRGNIYVDEKKGDWGEGSCTIRGYFNQQDKRDGPAIVLFDYVKETWFADFTLSNSHRICK